MKIVVNTRFLIHDQLEGIGVFSKNVLEKITKAHPEHEFIFLFDRKFHPSFIFSDNVKGHVLFPPARHPFLWYLWFEHAVASYLNKEKPDLFLSLDGYLSLKTNCKTLLVIHDLAFEHYPKDVPWLASNYYRWFTPKFAQKAKHIITVSEFSKQDISKRYEINEGNISVVYNGADEKFKPLSAEEKTQVKAELTGGTDYFVYLGSVHPRKNIPNLLVAFDKFKKQSGADVKLVIIGRSFFKNQVLNRIYEAMEYKKEVVFTGKVFDADLKNYLGGALALTYVSYFEGFGIPVLEAMQCDVPVITSNLTSMPEVADDAALLIDPFNVDDIVKAMLLVYQNETFRSSLIEKGRIQRTKFSWDNTAEKVWGSIEKITGIKRIKQE